MRLDSLLAAIDSLDDDDFGARWSGKLVLPKDGWYALGAEGFNSFKVFFEGKLLLSFRNVHHAKKVYYDIQVDFWNFHGDANMHLLWSVPGHDYKAEALAAVDQADGMVMCLGLSPRLEGEEMKVEVDGLRCGDRLTLDLPKIQIDLMKAVMAKGKPTALVLLNGSAVSVNWADEHVPAILEAWYPGQAAGAAISDVLFGDYNPGGRLSATFYKSVDQLPSFSEYNMVGQTYQYFTDEPLYQFGHGLSYTSFEYSDLTTPASTEGDELMNVSVVVKNSGNMAGDEVVQLYVTDVEASVPVPVRSLQGFKRISLKPGEQKTVSFTLTPYQISLWDKDFKRVVESGVLRISVGGSQPGTVKSVTTQIVEKEVNVTSIAYLE